MTHARHTKEHYLGDSHFVLQQNDDGGVRRRPSITTMAVRRVKPAGRPEELQIEIDIAVMNKHGNARREYGGITLDAKTADALAKACAEINK